MPLPYNSADAAAIDSYTEKLIGKTLRQTTTVTDADTRKGRGDLGRLVEKFFYEISPENTHMPDFAEAGVELKVTGLKKLKSGTLAPKERLVLSMINYHAVVEETFHDSYLLNKIRVMLIVFYLYSSDVSVIDMRFLAKRLWQLPEDDLSLIMKDWLTIVDKIKAGKAHELSEGDTLYLGACTKSSNSSKRTSQPFSDEPAKPRAFALKSSYVRAIMEETFKHAHYEELLNRETIAKRSLDQEVAERLAPFIDRRVDDLFKEYGKDINPASKDKYALLTNRLLGVRTRKVSEFEKAGIIIRTVRLQKHGVPKEGVSFPTFDYREISKQNWEESDFKDIVESKFFFVILRETDAGLVFKGGKFWAMPYEDRQEAERVWHETVKRIKEFRPNDLPLTEFSPVAHVRPHGRTGKDKIIAPGGIPAVKRCFWLNARYVGGQLANSVTH